MELQAAMLDGTEGAWAVATLSILTFDVLSALMFSRLESWRREAAFEQAMIYARNQQYADGSITYPAARYASDVQGLYYEVD